MRTVFRNRRLLPRTSGQLELFERKSRVGRRRRARHATVLRSRRQPSDARRVRFSEARTCVDNRTLSFFRFFLFTRNTNKKLLGTCLCVHLCVYYALQWFSMYVIQRARRALSLSLSLSLSFRVKYIKILLCVYNTRGAL